VNDKLTVTYDLLYDYCATDDESNLNQGFQASYSFGNNEILHGPVCQRRGRALQQQAERTG